MLFKPFDLGKWFTIGFCAWLAFLGEAASGGLNSGFNNNINSHNQNTAESFRQFYDRVRDYMVDNLYWIVPVALAAALLLLALWILILWLSSRGRFMFLHCVALDKAEVGEPWNRFGSEANSLFWFRLVLGLISMVFGSEALGATTKGKK